MNVEHRRRRTGIRYLCLQAFGHLNALGARTRASQGDRSAGTDIRPHRHPKRVKHPVFRNSGQVSTERNALPPHSNPNRSHSIQLYRNCPVVFEAA